MARQAKLRCPNCGTQVTVFDDEIGEAGHCPGCGADMAVLKHDFRAGKHGAARDNAKPGTPQGDVRSSLAARVASLAGRAVGRKRDEPEEKAGRKAGRNEPEQSDGDMLAGLIEDDAEGMAAAEEALEETEAPAAAEPEAAAEVTQAAGFEAVAVEEPAEAAAPAAAPALGPGESFPRETEYRLWLGLAEEADDHAMVARLALWSRAEQAGCNMMLELPGGVEAPIPRIVLSDAAGAEAAGLGEGAWRVDWTRRLLKMAAETPDEVTIEGVVTVLNNTDDVILELKVADVWPWAAGDAS